MTPYEPHDPASKIQDYLVFGEFGDVNPSITDSSTYTFMDPGTMKELFEHEIEGCFLYSRHWNPSDCYLSRALAAMEDTPSAHATASGMSAIACAVMNLCSAGDEIVSARTVYGGTYALFKHLLPRFGVTTQFVDMDDLDQVRAAVTPKSKVIYTESLSNPLLSVADLPAQRCRRQAGSRQHLQPDADHSAPAWRPCRGAQPHQVHQRHQRLCRGLYLCG